jgi:hypothetical protein
MPWDFLWGGGVDFTAKNDMKSCNRSPDKAHPLSKNDFKKLVRRFANAHAAYCFKKRFFFNSEKFSAKSSPI